MSISIEVFFSKHLQEMPQSRFQGGRSVFVEKDSDRNVLDFLPLVSWLLEPFLDRRFVKVPDYLFGQVSAQDHPDTGF